MAINLVSVFIKHLIKEIIWLKVKLFTLIQMFDKEKYYLCHTFTKFDIFILIWLLYFILIYLLDVIIFVIEYFGEWR